MLAIAHPEPAEGACVWCWLLLIACCLLLIAAFVF